ncbi:MAG TPA: hypothetical protein ENK32_05900 [Anaerolineae bacterium]|nr:hypothetical protein [Anaerolineae bacterium]
MIVGQGGNAPSQQAGHPCPANGAKRHAQKENDEGAGLQQPYVGFKICQRPEEEYGRNRQSHRKTLARRLAQTVFRPFRHLGHEQIQSHQQSRHANQNADNNK